MNDLRLPWWFGLALTAVICGGALLKGGSDERNAAGGLLLSMVVTLALRDRSWAGIQWGAVFADTLLLAFLTAIALRSEKYWPLPAAAFQLLAVITHVARMVDPIFKPWAYATAEVIWTHMLLWTLGIGVFNTWFATRQPVISAPPGTAGATRR
jgi:hypothetical protein